MNLRHLVSSAVVSLVLCMPVGGFLLGFVECQNCGWNPLLRSFVGLFFAVLTPWFLGFPPQNEGGVGPPYNAWPYIAIAAVAIFVVLVALGRFVSKYEGPT
jgi:hypothetical protein